MREISFRGILTLRLRASREKARVKSFASRGRNPRRVDNTVVKGLDFVRSAHFCNKFFPYN
jgi:hypothetical protein